MNHRSCTGKFYWCSTSVVTIVILLYNLAYSVRDQLALVSGFMQAQPTPNNAVKSLTAALPTVRVVVPRFNKKSIKHDNQKHTKQRQTTKKKKKNCSAHKSHILSKKLHTNRNHTPSDQNFKKNKNKLQQQKNDTWQFLWKIRFGDMCTVGWLSYEVQVQLAYTTHFSMVLGCPFISFSVSQSSTQNWERDRGKHVYSVMEMIQS